MLEITIDGVPPFDGAFSVDFEQPLNGRELHAIKQLAGVRMGEMTEALEAGDYDVIVAFAVIALARHGKIEWRRYQEAFGILMEAEMGKITSRDTLDEQGDDAGPPAEAPPVSGESSSSSSVTLLPTGEGSQETTPPSTGSPGWATGAG